MADPVSWMIASAAMTAVGGITQARAQSQAAGAAAQAAHADALAAIDELTRQQQEVARVAREEKSDRMRQAEADLARARAASAEGFGMLHREVAELGYLEGLDLSRIAGNRDAQLEALQSKKKAAARGAENAADNARRTHKAAAQGAFLTTIGAGVQLGAKKSAHDAAERRAQNLFSGFQYGMDDLY